MEGRPRRVPPPPPPGFGDEEYYALYGTPEQYQRYRRDLERATKEGSPGSPQHEEYYVYRRYKSHEESYDYYYGPRHGRESEGRRGTKRRIAPPPPPGFGDSPPPVSRRRLPSPLPSTGEEESGEEEGGPPVFKNFKVTIKNGEEGTPSLSDSEEEERGKSKKRRKRKKEREREKRKRLEKKLAKREEELKLLSKKRNISGGGVEEGELKESKPRNIRDRLGARKEDIDLKWGEDGVRRGNERMRRVDRGVGRGNSPGPSRGGPGPSSGSAESRRQELLRRAEVRRQNQERSPIARADLRKRSPVGGRIDPRRRKGGSQRDRSARSPPASPKGRAGPRAQGGKRSVTPRGRPGDGKKRKRKRKRERDRERLRRRGGLAESDKKVLEEENATMRAKLADRLSKRKPGEGGEAALQDRLAELAGQQAGAGEEEGSPKKSSKEEGSSRGKMRSDQVQQEVREATSLSPGRKWKHDKFDKRSLRGRSSPEQNDEEFGDHWSKIKSEKDKEKGRKKSKSGSRSRSRGKRRSRSRSKARVARKKKSRSRSRRSRLRDDSRRRGASESSKRSISRKRGKQRGRKTSRSASKSKSRSKKSVSQSPVRSRKSRRRRGKFSRSHSRSESESSESSAASQSRSRSPSNEKEGVNLGLSGALTADANTVGGTVVKYSEPPEARKPRRKWRLYVFKGNEELPILYIHRQSAYLLGRDRKVADVPLDHPSCSKQHSALQFRLVPFTRPDGTQGRRVQLYIMDLGSANGTFVNNNKVEPSKYVQLLEKDVLKFGFSSREYVLLHDQSKEEEEDLGVD